MTKRKIQYIIALMAFGSLGLIIFQFYWLGFTLRAKNEQFGSDVRDAMQRVVRRLGQQEFFYLAKQKMEIEEKQKQLVAIANPTPQKPKKLIKYPLLLKLILICPQESKLSPKAHCLPIFWYLKAPKFCLMAKFANMRNGR
jgi:hypothetical protein